jgi:bifunctional UDP-N-acetylglucosamine pyrophosphorylase / glucosamine-1-phosphate N-acetyltransferase
MGLNIVILAAGSGKRMASDMPKVLHRIGGVSMLERVITTAQSLDPDAIHVIYGQGGSLVPTTLHHLPVNWIEQKEQLGTGHAVLQALPYCDAGGTVLVLYGDVPLISIRTLRQLMRDTPQNGLGLVVTESKDPTGFGRIVRNEMGNIVAIVEHKDATPSQRHINEINTGILTTSQKNLKNWLPRLNNENKQNEYYLTDIVSLAVEEGHPVGGVMAHCHEEVQGVNDRWQQSELERYFQQTQAKQLAYSGVTIRDPSRLDVRGSVKIGKDVILDVNVVLEGNVEIGNGCVIGPGVILKDVTIGRYVEIKAHSVIDGAKISDECVVGPFARLRPGTVIEAKASIGNFVEIKQTRIGMGSKVNHLTYMGDSSVGKGVNIGAGVITCNYDGINKWPTTIADGAFVGSNCSLVAPITIGKNATIGSGSIITKDAPDERLTLSVNLEQRAIKSWKRPEKKAVDKVRDKKS